MSFKLDLGPTDVTGNFHMDVFSGSSAALASLSMAGVAGPLFGGPTANVYENITGKELESEPLWNNAEWRVTGVNGEFPITLAIYSVLDADPLFSPVLTLDLSGDLQLLVAGVPSPVLGAGLPGLVFAFGGVLAWWRLRYKFGREVPPEGSSRRIAGAGATSS